MKEIPVPEIFKKVQRSNLYCPICFKDGQKEMLFRPSGDWGEYRRMPNGREEYVTTPGKKFPYYCTCSYRSDEGPEKPISQEEMDYYNQYMRGETNDAKLIDQ